MTSDKYQQQVEAILSGDAKAFSKLIGWDNWEWWERDRDDPTLAYSLWSETGQFSESLFAYLPQCEVCVTQLRSVMVANKADPSVLEDLGLGRMVGLMPELATDERIDPNPWQGWEPNRRELEAIAEYQRRVEPIRADEKGAE